MPKESTEPKMLKMPKVSKVPKVLKMPKMSSTCSPFLKAHLHNDKTQHFSVRLVHLVTKEFYPVHATG